MSPQVPRPAGELIRNGVVAAPMAGGPTTPELVIAVAAAGGFGFLAGGVQAPHGLRTQIAAVRAGSAEPFGVNLFVPGSPAESPEAVERYIASLRDDATALGARLGEPRWDDDAWTEKVGIVVEEAPAAVTFGFGVPPADVVAEIRAAGSAVGITVTTPAEAAAAATTGADWLIVQGAEAGGHRSSHHNDPSRDADWSTLGLVAVIAGQVPQAVIAAGGITTASAAAAAIAAGADAIQAGTAFMLSPEAGTHPLHRAAFRGEASTTAVTRAFSGRPARAIVNAFVNAHDDAPAAFPEIDVATRSLRAAAAAAGDTARMSLWAGQCFGLAEERPACEIVEQLGAGVRAGRRAR